MSAPEIQPPADDELKRVGDLRVASREPVRSTGLSIVERLHLENSERTTAILKTTVPAMKHESRVQEFASNLKIGATRVLASDGDAQFPWLVQEDLGAAAEPRLELTHDEVASVLESLAEFHATARVSSDMMSGVPDRSPAWLWDHIDEVISVVEPALAQIGVSAASGPITNGISLIVEAVSNWPITVVHGDFDPGNLVQRDGSWKTIDWGLSHLNTPFVDVAHMVMRFATRERLALVIRYIEAARAGGLEMPADRSVMELLRYGNMAHDAYFLWWHSYCVTELGLSINNFSRSLQQRSATIAGTT